MYTPITSKQQRWLGVVFILSIFYCPKNMTMVYDLEHLLLYANNIQIKLYHLLTGAFVYHDRMVV